MSTAKPAAARARTKIAVPVVSSVGIPEDVCGIGVFGGAVGGTVGVAVGVCGAVVVGLGVAVGVTPRPDTITTPFIIVPPGELWTWQ